MKKRDLTGMMRLKIYRFIRKFKQDHDGISPTTYEIADMIGVSRTTVRHHIEFLERLGLITLFGGQSARNIMLTGGYAAVTPEKLAEYERIIQESETRSIE